MIRAIAVAMMLTIGIIAPAPVLADPSYQCEAGPDTAIVNACAVRWEAANIRAHVAATDFGGASASCLNQTATLLEGLATKWLSDDKFTDFAGPWPCGAEPKVGKANDGALEQACPNAVWSYDDKGASGCNAAIGSDPKSIVVAATKRLRNAPYHVTFTAASGGTIETDFAPPGNTHTFNSGFESISIDSTTWTRSAGGNWNQKTISPEDMEKRASARAHIGEAWTVSDLGMQVPRTGGSPLHAYSVTNNATDKPSTSTYFLDGPNLVEIDFDTGVFRYSRFNVPVDIEPPSM